MIYSIKLHQLGSPIRLSLINHSKHKDVSTALSRLLESKAVTSIVMSTTSLVCCCCCCSLFLSPPLLSFLPPLPPSLFLRVPCYFTFPFIPLSLHPSLSSLNFFLLLFHSVSFFILFKKKILAPD